MALGIPQKRLFQFGHPTNLTRAKKTGHRLSGVELQTLSLQRARAYRASAMLYRDEVVRRMAVVMSFSAFL
jgi:hypothetical protein